MSHAGNTEPHPPQPVVVSPVAPAATPRQRTGEDALEPYHMIADTVGLVPSLRWKDNVFQAVFVAAFTFMSVIVGLLLWGFVGGLFCLVAGLFASIIISGIVLMVLGWVRAAKRLRR